VINDGDGRDDVGRGGFGVRVGGEMNGDGGGSTTGNGIGTSVGLVVLMGTNCTDDGIGVSACGAGVFSTIGTLVGLLAMGMNWTGGTVVCSFICPIGM
jgi:hypothetical protein